ncbi:tRNA threonylcarbamoyl adenosine modification protein YgjD [Orientia chuto str. Dubai]|uniref:tRNA N6-adenosine threonylcarbamoyltransferase n=1 Tax=Orientia chuto str. Dubai TaxID=1359168 RepID=A0A0F3MHY5_9RICK|nr:tRNA threonylcarbamoyl adenosine modification protein YgjD [Orientia chuto str. Dubai]
MNVIGIESSCDDTAIAVVNNNRKILANIVLSQHAEHLPYNGVVPEIAARSHLKNLKYAMEEALNQAQVNLTAIDIVAAASGPGLIGGVIVGSVFGHAVASTLNKTFFAINHLEGHILAVRLSNNNISFPYLLLLISGGHCQFIAVFDVGKYKILGQTIDDAVGEAFDKTARLLNLKYPGGPEIEKLAIKGNPHKYSLPLSMITKAGCNLSFSGLKTAVKQLIFSIDSLSEQVIYDICASFQYTVVQILKHRSINAIKLFESCCNSNSKINKKKYFVISGGVAANQYLRQEIFDLASAYGYYGVAPPSNLCTDNGAMIAWAGIERFHSNLLNSDFIPRAKWCVEHL